MLASLGLWAPGVGRGSEKISSRKDVSQPVSCTAPHRTTLHRNLFVRVETVISGRLYNDPLRAADVKQFVMYVHASLSVPQCACFASLSSALLAQLPARARKRSSLLTVQ